MVLGPDDDPGERGFLIRVLLLVGFAFEGAVERDREIQLVRGDDLAGAARKLRCVVYWIARTWRPAARARNADPAAAKISSGITDRLAINLPNATVPARSRPR